MAVDSASFGDFNNRHVEQPESVVFFCNERSDHSKTKFNTVHGRSVPKGSQQASSCSQRSSGIPEHTLWIEHRQCSTDRKDKEAGQHTCNCWSCSCDFWILFDSGYVIELSGLSSSGAGRHKHSSGYPDPCSWRNQKEMSIFCRTAFKSGG